MRPLEFLSNVWDHTATDGDFVFLSTKNPKEGWKEHAFEYKRGYKNHIKDFLQDHPSDKYDIYFCPLPFLGRKRLKNLVSKVNILWSDIDEGNPKIKPSILWESSPGRLQALWYLKNTLTNEKGEQLNKDLTYYMGADKGGWDLTQVLRVPGTRNHKYDSKPRVRVLEDNSDREYSPSKLRTRIGTSEETKTSTLTFEKIFSKYRRAISARVKRLLTQKHVSVGKRSEILWYMENKLNEAGVTPEEILVLIKNSAWNKFKGRKDEDHRLKSELEKIIEVNTDTPDEVEIEDIVEKEDSWDMQVDSYSGLMSSLDRPPGWLVEGFWMSQSHGIIAGEPKTFKSTLAMDLAVSVASGTPFLGKHKVMNPGPVFYIQNENAKWIIKDRLMKIAHSRGLMGSIKPHQDKWRIQWPTPLPINFINQQSFLLTDPLHQKILEQSFQKYKPSLLILDPLYLMFDGDINSAKDLNFVLSWLLEMRFKYKCAVVVIHHYNKGGQGSENSRGGQRMLGSTTLHGWIESAWYMSVKADQTNQIMMDREFRGAGIHEKLSLTVNMEETGKVGYSVNETIEEDLDDRVLNFIRDSPNGVTTKEISMGCKIKTSKVVELVDQFCDDKLTIRKRSKILAR